MAPLSRAACALLAAPWALAAPQPCDILGAAGTPCVAAHSMVRALYSSYGGPLYQVQRASDKTMKDIAPLAPGGLANAAEQDAFCAKTTCTVHQIFDQSPRGNHLGTAPAGGAGRSPDLPVDAAKGAVSLGGHRVYGAYFEGGQGYRNNTPTGIAVGDEPQTMYMVVDGTRYNEKCCFDYGNAERNNLDLGEGTMEAIYWGTSTGWGRGAGSGPWVMADLENGLWAGNQKENPGNKPIKANFVTAMVKGRSGSFALKGGDAQQGPLNVLYDGPRPAKYNPMKKQGAIILGIGGDNSNWAIGTFYEGVMASGVSTDAADAAVHANVVAAGYGRSAELVV